MVFITSGHFTCALWPVKVGVCSPCCSVHFCASPVLCDGSCPIAPEQMCLCNSPVPSPRAWMMTYRREHGVPQSRGPEAVPGPPLLWVGLTQHLRGRTGLASCSQSW